MRETTSTASAATPTQDDTLALVPRDRRGACAGVAADLRRLATWLPHHAPCGVATAERSHAIGDEPIARASMLLGVRCLRARRHGGRPGPDRPADCGYTVGMKPTDMPTPATHIGHVKNGVVVLDPRVPLVEGQAVRVEPLSPADLAADRDSRVEQLRQLFDQWTEEDAHLSEEDADRLQNELNQRQRVRFRAADV